MVIVSSRARPPEILLIDDNHGDAKLIKIAFKRAMSQAHITVADTAEHGISLLRGDATGRAPPDLVFLDLNLPTMHGLTFLEIIKSDPDLRAIPVLVVSSSGAQKDVTESYRRHASGFVTKPFDLEGYEDFATQIINYWFNLVQIPTPAAVPRA
jgi:CheY-like chemotaxis protein